MREVKKGLSASAAGAQGDKEYLDVTLGGSVGNTKTTGLHDSIIVVYTHDHLNDIILHE